MRNFENGDAPPTLITFNYDLSLERSLHNAIQRRNLKKHQPSIRSYSIDYGLGEKHLYDAQLRFLMINGQKQPLIKPLKNARTDDESHLSIKLYKLHGSLSFASNHDDVFFESKAAEEPNICPPVFNKKTDKDLQKIWVKATNALSECKNLHFCGYSLPQTDVYMNYFIKAGVGPNTKLSRVYVFDILNTSDSNALSDLKERYLQCFSPQLQNRIHFMNLPEENDTTPGSFMHLAEFISKHPKPRFTSIADIM